MPETLAPPRAGAATSAADDAGDREFALRDSDFERICRLIHQRAGIALAPSKRTMVYSRLARRLRALGDPSFATYLERLNDAEADEWQHFINALTTNLTAFFREPHHFEIFAQQLARLRGAQAKLRIWCCAASTGEEPYSIAMTVVEALGSFNVPVEIIASDIDTHVLEKAERGVYPLDALKGLSSERLSRFFRRGVGRNEGFARVRPELARLIQFQQVNLLAPQWSVGEGFSAIFCRNVMIYFDRPTQLRILERFAPRLVPGGLLFAGHSENLSQARDFLKPLGQTVYQVTGLPGRTAS